MEKRQPMNTTVLDFHNIRKGERKNFDILLTGGYNKIIFF